jgi:RHS repeat-associated protein
MSVTPAQAQPGEMLTLTVVISTPVAVPEALLSVALPTGVGLASSGGPWTTVYSEATRAVSWSALLVPPGRTESSLILRISEDAPDLSVLRAELRAAGFDGVVLGQALLRRAFPATECIVTPQEGGTLSSADGRVLVKIPAGAVEETLRLVHVSVAVDMVPVRHSGLALRFELNAFAADAGGAPVHAFARPFELRVDLHGLVDWSVMPLYQQPFLGVWNEQEKEWVSIAARRQGDVLIADLDHLSTFGGGTGSNHETGWLLTFNDAHVGTFNGGLNYEYPIAVPAGRGGLTPDVHLSYNSRRVDGILTWIQSDWLGLGWTLDSMSIVRAVTPTADWEYGYVDWSNAFTLLYKGTGYRLIPGSTTTGYGRYYLEDEQFLYVQRHTISETPSYEASNSTGEYWEVRLRDGTECRLGHNSDSEQVITTEYYDSDSGDRCHWTAGLPGGHPPPSEACYAGHAWETVAFQWRVDTITDTHGNVIRFEYHEESQADPTRERASYLDEIYYNWLDGAATWGTRIGFNRATRGADDVKDNITTSNSLYFYQDSYLSSVEIQNYQNAAYTTVREYQFTYSQRDVPADQYDNHTRRLASIQEYGRYGLDGGQTLPATSLGYEVEQNKGICHWFWGESCTDGLNDDWDQESFRYERLVTVSNGYGGSTVLDYGHPADEDDWWQSWNWRVESKLVSDGYGGGSRWAYDYTAPLATCYDNNTTFGCDGGITQPGGSLVGYQRVTTTLSTVGSVALSITGQRFFTCTEGTPNRALGRETESLQRDPDGNDLLKTVTTWATETLTTPVTRYFVYTAGISDYLRENGALPATAQKSSSFEYQTARQNGTQYGNVTRQVDYTGATGIREIVHWYYPNTTVWIVDHPGARWVRDPAGNGASGTQYIYDDLGHGYSTPPDRGDLVKTLQTTQALPSEVWITTSCTTYDADVYYQAVEATDGNGNGTRTLYDSVWKMYPVIVTQVLSLVDASQNLTTTTDYSTTLGLPTRVLDANGDATSYQYDAFGRLVKVIRPGDSSTYPTLVYQYCDTCTPLRISTGALVTAGAAITLPVHRFYNGLGQLIAENQGTMNGSQMAIRHLTYEATGQQYQAYLPYTATYALSYVSVDTSKPKETSSYDALGRAALVTHTDGTTMCTVYNGLSWLTLDESGHQKAYSNDGLGRLVRVKEYATTQAAPSWTATAYATTTYGYDLLDSLTRVTDTLGYTTVITYDARGLKTGMRDPDMGLWSYAYDYAGNLITQTDALGQATILHYDRQNRLTMREYPGGSGATSVTYSYDSTAGGNRGKGRRTAMADGSGSTSWTYDTRGRTTAESKVITVTGSSTQNLLTQWSYTTRDVAASQTYPGGTGGEAGQRVQTDYDVWGRPVVVSGTSLYVTSAAYDALGRPAAMALGSGQQTQYVYYTATQQGGRLYQIKTGTSGAPDSTQYLQYGYDRVGNVTVITDHNNSGQLQLFAYDALNRLTTAAAIGGLDGCYTRTYQYDAIGNMTLGDGGYYYYDRVRPHAVITVGNPLSSMTAYYGYDGNGSATFITRTLLSMTYTLTYDPENRVKQVVPSDGPTATFRYDGDGTRVLGIVGGVTTTYAGTWYEYTTAGVSYYYLNGQRIAVRTGSGVTYIHRDHLGSAVTTTGVLTQGQRYDAWGETRGTSAVDTPYRYTGQRQEDDLLLYFYNARWYDAALGRFIQADSIVPEPGNPQSLNRYSYVQNNPLRHSDPTGHALDDGFGVRWRYAPGGGLRAVGLFAPGAGQSDSDLTYFAVIEAQARAASGDVAELAHANGTLAGRRSTYPGFSALVGDGQRWEVKDEMNKQLGDSFRLCSASACGWYEYSVLGNILYGFAGHQAGFEVIELWLGAGYAEATDPENIAKQTGSKASPMLYLPKENLLYFGDNGQGFRAVSFGIALSRRYGPDVTAPEFKALLVAFDDGLDHGTPSEDSHFGWPYAPGWFDNRRGAKP